ncbi:polyphosphate kinase 1 [Gammaproteobacteria bacterium AB-CW1]|uniref:Polyphosphate kinase n=1 Tax=Natronospira elongata TaxID=3110268 RepID=A0AAP6JDZ0_9GAMM|nr:polyphosphate kinase 1 [Gammaproteobacteria bacterium AB-CW1]
MSDVDLKSQDLYINRELSLLEFNHRVLNQARDPDTPLLERLKFLCIATTNLDEFFEIRVAGLKQKLEAGSVETGPDGLPPKETLRAISQRARQLVADQYYCFNRELLPALQKAGIRILKRDQWNNGQQAWLKRFFRDEVQPLLSPMGLDPAHPFPRILNKSLNFVLALEGKDAFGRNRAMAVLQAPRSLPRVIQLPRQQAGNKPHTFVFLSSIIHAFADDLFPGMQVSGCYQFRVTRNSDLFVDEEEVDDLLRALEGELPARRYGDEVRLEVADDCPDDMAEDLLVQFGLTQDDLYRVDGPVNLNRLMAVYERVDGTGLKYPSFVPGLPRRLAHNSDIFEVLRKQELLLHHPFESFLPVIDFVRQASADPQVVAVKQTLYRTGPESAIVNALVEAAKSGKEVTVVIELRARFDEADNINLANRLQEAGAHVLYGVVGYKTHAKMILVVRREGRRLRRYVHLGTGNYHPRTARLYTDYGLLSADRTLAEDVHKVFMQLTSLGKVSKLKKIIHSPFTLHKGLMERIDREIEHASSGKTAQLIIKVNSLVEPALIRRLYEASAAGVQIDCIVRGMCSLRPGVKGVSDHIRVRSIVGRFLEHTRVFWFLNGGDDEVFCASADLMERNLFRRVETCFPVQEKTAHRRLSRDLKSYLKDNSQAWALQSDGQYRLLTPGRTKPHTAQAALLDDLAERS